MSTKNWIGTGAQSSPGSLRIVRNSDGYILDASNDTFTDPISVVSEYYTPTESTPNPGTYSWTLAGANWGTDTYRWYWYAGAGGTGDVVVSAMTLVSDEEPVAETSINQQDVRDAMKLAPSAGAAAADSIDAKLTDTLADTNELQLDWVDGGRLDLLLDTAAAGGGGGVSVADMITGGIATSAKQQILVEKGFASYRSISEGITSVEWEGDPWQVGEGIEIFGEDLVDNGSGGWQGSWNEAAYRIIGDAQGTPTLDAGYTPANPDVGALIGICDYGTSGSGLPVPEGRLTIIGNHNSGAIAGANKIIIHTTGGKLECCWLDAFGNLLYEGSFLNVSMPKLALASDVSGGGGGGLDAAGVRAAIGMTNADLDTQLSNIPAEVRDVSNASPAAGSLGEDAKFSGSGMTPAQYAALAKESTIEKLLRIIRNAMIRSK